MSKGVAFRAQHQLRNVAERTGTPQTPAILIFVHYYVHHTCFTWCPDSGGGISFPARESRTTYVRMYLFGLQATVRTASSSSGPVRTTIIAIASFAGTWGIPNESCYCTYVLVAEYLGWFLAEALRSKLLPAAHYHRHRHHYHYHGHRHYQRHHAAAAAPRLTARSRSSRASGHRCGSCPAVWITRKRRKNSGCCCCDCGCDSYDSSQETDLQAPLRDPSPSWARSSTHSPLRPVCEASSRPCRREKPES